MAKFKRVAIIGVGLMGGSLGLALKSKGIASRVVGIGRRESSLQKALQKKAVDETTLSLEEGVKGCDLVVLATPVGSIVPLLERLASNLEKDCLVTDVGSTKEKIVLGAEKVLPEGVCFCGSHPMAGSEKRGVEEAREDLYEGSVCVVTPGTRTNDEDLKRVQTLWTGLGATVINMTPKLHDRLVVGFSHLPHLVAVAVVLLAEELAKEDPRAAELAAGGFRDTTRIACSSPELWRDIFRENAANVISLSRRLREILSALEEKIQMASPESLERDFGRAKDFRDRF